MALNGKYQTPFGSNDVHYVITEYRVSRATGAVVIEVGAYASEVQRAVFSAALKRLADASAMMPRAAAALQAAPNDAAWREAVNALDHDMRSAKLDMKTNQAQARSSFSVPVGEIVSDADGNVTLAAMYSWLKSKHLAGAIDA